MLSETAEVLRLIWWRMLLGGALLLTGTAIGWAVGRETRLRLTRLVGWWMRRVVLPLVKSPSWGTRFVAIAVNNGTILAMIVLMGRWEYAAIVAVGALGVSLGVGLRVLSAEPEALFDVGPGLGAAASRRVRLGVVLNLLEPPAILLALGLALGRLPAPLSSRQAWAMFLFWILPATIVAAGGEALWLGACLGERSKRDRADESPESPA